MKYQRVGRYAMLFVVLAIVAAVAVAQQPAGAAWSENFDSQTLDGWELLPGARVVAGPSGGMLTTECPSHGIWVAANHGDMVLEFDYFQGAGAAQIVLRGSGEPPYGSGYRISFAEGVKIDVQRTQEGVDRGIASGAIQVQPGVWHRVGIQAAGGWIEVSVNGSWVLRVGDPDPLGPGMVALGCTHGEGFAFDNVRISAPEENAGFERPIPEIHQPATSAPRPAVRVVTEPREQPHPTRAPVDGESADESAPRHGSGRRAASFCGQAGFPSVTDFQVRSAAQTQEAAARTPFQDSAYGTCVVRVTDRDSDLSPGDSSPGLTPEYSRVQAFNADDSRFIVRGTEGSWYLYDMATLRPLAELPIEDEPRWHPTNPSLLYFVDDIKLRSFDVDSQQITTVHDFASDFAGQSIARVSTRYEGRFSADGRYWGAMAQNENWDPVAFAVFDITAGRTTAIRDLRGLPGVGDGIDFVTISPSGEYFLAGFDRLCARGSLGTDQQPCGLMVYDRDLSNGRGLLRFAAHSDTALDDGGREVVVFQDIDTDHISTVDLATGQVVDLWPIDFSHTAIGLHFSGCAFNVPGWALVSTHDDDLGSHTWMDDQVFAMELAPGGRVYRLAHTHSVTMDGAHGAYWAEPHGTVNRDFTKVLFGTNWNRVGTEEVETYLIDLPSGWIQKGKTP